VQEAAAGDSFDTSGRIPYLAILLSVLAA